MKIRIPLIYASPFEELKYFWIFEDKTIEDEEIDSSISLIKPRII